MQEVSGGERSDSKEGGQRGARGLCMLPGMGAARLHGRLHADSRYACLEHSCPCGPHLLQAVEPLDKGAARLRVERQVGRRRVGLARACRGHGCSGAAAPACSLWARGARPAGSAGRSAGVRGWAGERGAAFGAPARFEFARRLSAYAPSHRPATLVPTCAGPLAALTSSF